MNRFVLSLCVALAACSSPPPPPTHAANPTHASSTPHAVAVPGARPVSVASSPHGLRASYSECIDRAEAVIPETQACIEAEAAFQQTRLDRALVAAKRAHPDQAGAIQFQQTMWQADIDAKCAWDARTEGQQQRIEANMCSLEAIAARADQLGE